MKYHYFSCGEITTCFFFKLDQLSFSASEIKLDQTTTMATFISQISLLEISCVTPGWVFNAQNHIDCRILKCN